jgi:DNA polymerase III subunit epsilon
MYLAIDTEAAGTPRTDIDPDHRSQPQLRKFSGIVFDDSGRETDQLITLVRATADEAQTEVLSASQGATLNHALSQGTSEGEVLHWFNVRAADATLIIGHNVHLDLQVLRIGCARLGMTWKPVARIFSTMHAATAVAPLPSTNAVKAAENFQPSAPTLAEAFEQFFGENLDGALDIRSDVQACIKVFRHLQRLIGKR